VKQQNFRFETSIHKSRRRSLFQACQNSRKRLVSRHREVLGICSIKRLIARSSNCRNQRVSRNQFIETKTKFWMCIISNNISPIQKSLTMKHLNLFRAMSYSISNFQHIAGHKAYKQTSHSSAALPSPPSPTRPSPTPAA
jgi:hypothetical protein